MPFVETKTDRTLVVSMCLGPPGPFLHTVEYRQWLDSGQFAKLVRVPDVPLDTPPPRLRRRRR